MEPEHRVTLAPHHNHLVAVRIAEGISRLWAEGFADVGDGQRVERGADPQIHSFHNGEGQRKLHGEGRTLSLDACHRHPAANFFDVPHYDIETDAPARKFSDFIVC
ncbi:hypothetical protein SDC9_88854 [bioreactor metagenome]|uniref:Uncharacterized protein n=1 Tax=bioreactor metagenome TaxID=1076179 RepID=A0A644ZQM9_9ZZZZ